jgi:hypothetical protein
MVHRRVIPGITDPDLQEAYAQSRRFLRRPYVTGVSIGEAVRGGVADGIAVCVHVEQKVAKKSLSKAQRLPIDIAGIPIDVVERRFVAHSLTAAQRQQRRLIPQNPAPPGVEVAAHNGEPGSLGAVVVDLLTPLREPCLLTAAHVLAVAAGTAVYQPGTGAPGTLIGHVRRRILSAICDGALAVLDAGRSLTNLPAELNSTIRGCRRVKPDDVLVKSGMMTGVTRAVVKHFGEFTISMPNYSSRTMTGFVLLPLTGVEHPICDRGDSGAIWYDEETGQGVGIHIAGDTNGPGYADDAAFACNLTDVLEELHAIIP